MYEINPSKQLEVMRWLMYAWDGQWVNRTTAVYGPVEAGKLNARVRSAFGKIEMKALLALLGKKQAANLADAAEMLKTYFGLMFAERGFQGRFLPLVAAPGGNARLQVEVTRHTAFDSLKKIARAAGENPELACELLWNSWLETLLPDAQIQVIVRKNGEADLYQIDSLSETFSVPVADNAPAELTPAPEISPAELPTVVAPPAFQPEPAQTFPPPFVPAAPPAPAQTFPPPFMAAPAPPVPAPAPPAPASVEELSPIAQALQIPLEQVAPPATPVARQSTLDPYGPEALAMTPPVKKPAAPVIGASEPGAQENLNQGRSGAALQAGQPAAAPAQDNGANQTYAPPFQADLASEPAVTPPEPEPAPSLGIDPSTGRPLFSGDAEAGGKGKKDRGKNAPMMSRLFISKEGRELMAKGTGQPTVKVNSLAGNIDLILQRKLPQARAKNPGAFPEQIRVVGGPEGELQIIVGQHVFQSVNDIPPGPIRELLQQSVAEWSESQR